MSHTIEQAIVHHRAGRLPQARDVCRQILLQSPEHPDALNVLGVIALQSGEADAAVNLIARAARAAPANPACHINLGDALRAAGRDEDARESYRRASAVRPLPFALLLNVGNALVQRGLHEDALVSFNGALALQPDAAGTHYNRANSLHTLGRLDEALASYRQAIALQPAYAEAHNNMGKALLDRSQTAEAVSSYRAALRLRPGYVEAHNNLGNALAALGDTEAAAASYRQALALAPHDARPHNNLALLAGEMRRFGEAEAGFRHALQLQPALAEAHYNLGVLLGEQGRPEEEAACYQRVLTLQPGHAMAYSNLLFLRSYQSLIDASAYLALARGWEQACVPPPLRRAAQWRQFARAPLAGRKLRIGYVSGDFRRHAVAYFIEQILARHDRARVTVVAYSTNRKVDDVTQRLQALADHWRPIAGLADAAICERIEADGIDVLIDLSGHTAHHRLDVFARRAAPVQAHYLGYFASTGLTEMDYWIGDALLTPPQDDAHFSEKVWRLPRPWLCYRTLAEAPDCGWRPAADGSLCVGSFNGLGKLTPLTIALWARLLHALPQARLLLKNSGFADAGNRQRMTAAFAGQGIAAGRLTLEAATEWKHYMAQHDRLDIALDPVGAHGGGTSTCDALWMGVPVIHLPGDRTTSRYAASLLGAVAHDDWIAHSETDYIDKAVALARDVTGRQALRATQRQRMAASPLCDEQDMVRRLEEAYFEMFIRWQERQAQHG